MALLDKTDLNLLELLQKDSTQTIKQLAARLHLTPTPVYERIKRLEKKGIIERYKAVLNLAKLGKNLLIFSHVSLKEHALRHLEHFESSIQQLNEVIACYHVSGEHDYLLKVIVADMEDYRRFLTEKLAKVDNIGNVHSSFVVKAIKDEPVISLNSL